MTNEINRRRAERMRPYLDMLYPERKIVEYKGLAYDLIKGCETLWCDEACISNFGDTHLYCWPRLNIIRALGARYIMSRIMSFHENVPHILSRTKDETGITVIPEEVLTWFRYDRYDFCWHGPIWKEGWKLPKDNPHDKELVIPSKLAEASIASVAKFALRAAHHLLSIDAHFFKYSEEHATNLAHDPVIMGMRALGELLTEREHDQKLLARIDMPIFVAPDSDPKTTLKAISKITYIRDVYIYSILQDAAIVIRYMLTGEYLDYPELKKNLRSDDELVEELSHVSRY